MIGGRPAGNLPFMWPYHPDLLATPVPRYTSFPTAAEFGPDVGPADFDEVIAGATGDVSLYVHIPFCEKICWYCGCNTAAANRSQRLTSYLDALHREIALVAAKLPQSARIRRFAFGGGSPNALATGDFLRLFDALATHFALDNPLVSIELDPRTLSDGWGEVLRTIGASNASLGVQTFAPRLQQAIGRVQPLAMIERSVGMLRDAGVTSLNFDLMYGLPGQSEAELDESLELAAGYGGERVALFGYAHVPHMIARQRRIDASALPGPRARFRMAALGHHQMVNNGYVPVGFDHFALPGDPLAQAATSGRLQRNFQGFTEDEAPVLIGLGASAISQFPNLLAQNEKNSGRYRMILSQGKLPIALGKPRSDDDRRRGQVIEDILCRGHTRVDAAILQDAWPRLTPFVEARLCAIEHGELVLSPMALPYARGIAACFDPYRQQSARRFSSAV